MIYPIDIYAKTQKGGGKASDADKAKIAMGVVLAVITGVIIMTATYWGAIGIPLPLMVITGIILWLFISLQIFRFVIFREQDRDLEESDLFLPYYKIRPGTTKIKNPFGTFDMYELKNNSFLTVLQFRLGRNTGNKSQGTEIFLNKMQDLIHEKKLKHTMVWMKEDFVESEEAMRMLNNVNNVKEPQLRASLLAIYNEVFTFTETHSSVMSCYVMIYAPSNFVKDELEDAIVQIMSIFNKEKHLHALRSIEALDQQGIMKFFQHFYGLGAIDLSLSKIQFNTMNSEVLKSMELYRIISKNGKIYSNPILAKISTGVKFFGE